MYRGDGVGELKLGKSGGVWFCHATPSYHNDGNNRLDFIWQLFDVTKVDLLTEFFRLLS